MKVLIIGSGGREHALVCAIAKSPLVEQVYCAPGNAGTEERGENKNIKAGDIQGLKQFALAENIALTVVGPEDPLAAGIVDEFEAVGLQTIGPSKNAAALEGSKIFARELLAKHGIPSAEFEVFTNTDEAHAFIEDNGIFPIVIKVDGLAAGKGAMVCFDLNDATKALERIKNREFGDAGNKFLIEEYLPGEEASYIVLVDKNGNIVPLASSQDHKPVYDGDKGPNTGGMGAYSPAPVVTREVESRILDNIIKPTIKAMAEKRTPFMGFLYAGLMIDKNGDPRVVEFNVRLGDPETQPILARMKTDIVEILLAMVKSRLDTVEIEWDSRVAVSVVMAEEGYPGQYEKGHEIRGIKNAERSGAIVNHAGTIRRDQEIILTNGGRILSVTALGESFRSAIDGAYSGVGQISWGSEYYRNDIGHRALNR